MAGLCSAVRPREEKDILKFLQSTSGCIRRDTARLATRHSPYSPSSSSSSHSLQWQGRPSCRQSHKVDTHCIQLEQQHQQQQPCQWSSAEAWPAAAAVAEQPVLPATRLGTCMAMATRLCTRSLEKTMAAVNTAHSICASCADFAAVDRALDKAEALMNETIRRVRLAVKLAQLVQLQELAGSEAPGDAFAGAGGCCCGASCLDSSLCRQQQQQQHYAAAMKAQAAAVGQVNLIMLHIQQLQQQRKQLQSGCILGAQDCPSVQHKQLQQVVAKQLELSAQTEALDTQEEVASSWE